MSNVNIVVTDKLAKMDPLTFAPVLEVILKITAPIEVSNLNEKSEHELDEHFRELGKQVSDAILNSSSIKIANPSRHI